MSGRSRSVPNVFSLAMAPWSTLERAFTLSCMSGSITGSVAGWKPLVAAASARPGIVGSGGLSGGAARRRRNNDIGASSPLGRTERRCGSALRVGGRRPLGLGLRLGVVRAAGEVRNPPALAAADGEPLALLRCASRHEPGGVDRFARGDVQVQPDASEIPADADRARSELLPVLVDRNDVLELQLGLLGGGRRETDLDPADLLTELPRRGEA